MNPKILIYTDWFYPAYKAGGPVQSIYRLIQLLRKDYDIYILTSTEDLDNSIEDQLSAKNQFIFTEGIHVNYLDSSNQSLSNIKKLLHDIKPNFIFFNGLFNKYFYKPLFFHLISRQDARLFVSIRGMLKPSALNQKGRKKKMYLWILRRLVNKDRVVFHCTTKEEKLDLITNFGEKQSSIVIANIPFLSDNTANQRKFEKLNLVYAARIHPIKNLHFLINLMKQVKSEVKLTIIGVIDDKKYWLECSHQINQLPSNIIVDIVGDLKHRELMNILPNFDVYILPTHGENFGHSIFEALSAGLPVIISDQTPWKNLEAQKVGFDIPLDEPNRFVKAIEFFAKCNETEWKEWSINSRQYAKEFYVNQNFEEAYKRLFKLKINVGFVAPITLTRYRGGISVLAEHYLSHKSVLEERGIELHLFNTCTLPRGNESTGKFRWINIKNYIKFVTKSIAKIKEEKTDLLHYNTSVGLSLLKDIVTVRIFKILTNTESILHIHSTDIDELEKENMYRKLFVFFLKRIHRIVVLSDKLRQDLLDLGLESNRVMVIQNYSMLSFKHSISPSQGTINIIFIGSLNRRKGVLDLFNAMQNLSSNLDWHMHVAGDFTSEDFKHQFFSKLEETNLINKVTFHGYVSDKEKKKLFEMSSILVLPSYSEGMPLSILEGLSAGCAILATNVGANKETIKSVANLIHPGDVEAIKFELEKLLINTEYLKNRQKQSLELSRKFSFQKFVDHIEPLYHESIL